MWSGEKNKGPDGWSGPFGFFIRVLVLILKLRCWPADQLSIIVPRAQPWIVTHVRANWRIKLRVFDFGLLIPFTLKLKSDDTDEESFVIGRFD